MELIETEFRQHQTPFLGWLGPKCFIVIDHPDHVQIVMNSKSCIEKSEVYRFFNRGVGLFTAPGTKFIVFAYFFLFLTITKKKLKNNCSFNCSLSYFVVKSVSRWKFCQFHWFFIKYSRHWKILFENLFIVIILLTLFFTFSSHLIFTSPPMETTT